MLRLRFIKVLAFYITFAFIISALWTLKFNYSSSWPWPFNRNSETISLTIQLLVLIVLGSIAIYRNRPSVSIVHIFMDNSNIYYSLSNAYGGRSLKFQGLVDLVRRDKHLGTNLLYLSKTTRLLGNCMLAGSVPPAGDKLWKHAQDAGFKTRLLQKLDGGREQGVDDIIHREIANTTLRAQPSLGQQLLQILAFAPAPVMCLLSGDGNDNEGYGGFPEQLELALDKGFDVEIYAFKHNLSWRLKTIVDKLPGRATIYYLDDYLDEISFRNSR